jgi:hypothetical protein
VSFNHGFMCALCGPIPKANKKTINKIPHNICPDCMQIVEVWERPENERPGRCSNCGYGSFKLAIVKGHLLRNCKKCTQVFDTETEKIIREGKAEFKV